MRKYWTVFQVNWQNALQYRGPTFISILGNLLHISVLLYLWNAIYLSNQRLGNYTLSDLITYYIIQLIINSMVPLLYQLGNQRSNLGGVFFEFSCETGQLSPLLVYNQPFRETL